MERDDVQDLVRPFSADYRRYAADESRWEGYAEHIAFPRDEAEVLRVLELCASRNEAVTVQGALTGITGGAVPQGGCILNLSRLNRIHDIRVHPDSRQVSVRVQPGVLLRDLQFTLQQAAREAVENTASPGGQRGGDIGRVFFPPDPTESSASLGGMIACNSSGAISFRYGPVRRYVVALRVGLVDGRILELRRDRERAVGRRFRLRASDGSVLEGDLPAYRYPRVKSAAGYFIEDDMDLLDLFVGSEGTLGIVLDAELKLIPVPPVRWGILAFLPAEGDAVALVEGLRPLKSAGLAALEFFGPNALRLLKDARARLPFLAELPELKKTWEAALYLEIHAATEDQAMDLLERIVDLLEEAGVTEEDTWSAEDRKQMGRMKELRHAVPELVNMQLETLKRSAGAITKLGTDMAVPDGRLSDAMDLYREGITAESLEAVSFGHIGDGHVHVNILAHDQDEYLRARRMYLQWARRIVAWGGTVSAEHGIGKLKVELLRIMYGDKGVAEMFELKRAFDPDLRLGRGTLFGRPSAARSGDAR